MKRRSPKAAPSFSMIELVVSLGLIAFCLTALLSLIPVGLGTIRSSSQQAGAANCLEQIATAIRGATTNASGGYQALGSYSGSLSWKLAKPPVTVTFTNLSLAGIPTAVASDQRLAAAVRIVPPADANSPGTALVTVAWPQTARWDAASETWTNPQGSLSTWVIFSPSP